jgi:hypothetical protein
MMPVRAALASSAACGHISRHGKGAMRVSIEHKEETKRLIRKTHAYFVTVTVQISEAERAIIKAQGLQEKPIDISPGVRASSVVNAIPNTLKLVGTIGMIVGFFATFFSIRYGWLAIFFFVGVALLLYGISLERKWKKGEVDTLSIKDLLAAPVVIHAFSPLDVKLVDDHVRASLAGIKDVIESSETPLNKAGFEP